MVKKLLKKENAIDSHNFQHRDGTVYQKLEVQKFGTTSAFKLFDVKNFLSQTDTYDLSCTYSSLTMPHPGCILQKYTIFGESDTHTLIFCKSPSNIA